MPVAHERGELAQEAVVSVNRDDAVLAADTLNDQDHARVDDEEVPRDLSRGEENVSGADRTPGPERLQTPTLVGVKPGEGAVAVDGFRKACPQRRLDFVQGALLVIWLILALRRSSDRAESIKRSGGPRGPPLQLSRRDVRRLRSGCEGANREAEPHLGERTDGRQIQRLRLQGPT